MYIVKNKDIMSTKTIQNLQIGKVKVDPNQPRKTFNEDSLNELAGSIKTYGVLQPITVRKSGKEFVIVMGERRYRASIIAGRKTIPAIVREFKDDEIMEIQIIENLQRKDVDAIEEAEAILFLKERIKPEEIAKRIGRTVQFVYSRLKLAQLIEGFRPYVREGKMTISVAVAVSAFPAEEQQMMLETIGDNFSAQRVVNLVQRQSFDLSKAPFDINNGKLLAKAGSCHTCPFNAANQGDLFGAGQKICTKSSCFQLKKEKSFVLQLRKAKKQNLLFIPKIYSHNSGTETNALIVAQIEKEGLEVLFKDNVDVLENPTKPTLESIKEENKWYNYTEEEFQDLLKEALSEFEDETEEYNNAEENGYSKAVLFFPDSYHCVEAYAKVREATTNSASLPVEKRKMDDCTPEEQIVKIKGREVRKKHIQNNKMFEEISKAVREANYIDNGKTLSTDEIIAFCFSIYENNVSYFTKREAYKDLFGTEKQRKNETQLEFFTRNFKKEVFHKLVRHMILNQLHFGEQNHINNVTNAAFYQAVRKPFKKEIDSIEQVYGEAENKRVTRMHERIKELEGKSEELAA